MQRIVAFVLSAIASSVSVVPSQWAKTKPPPPLSFERLFELVPSVDTVGVGIAEIQSPLVHVLLDLFKKVLPKSAQYRSRG